MKSVGAPEEQIVQHPLQKEAPQPPLKKESLTNEQKEIISEVERVINESAAEVSLDMDGQKFIQENLEFLPDDEVKKLQKKAEERVFDFVSEDPIAIQDFLNLGLLHRDYFETQEGQTLRKKYITETLKSGKFFKMMKGDSVYQFASFAGEVSINEINKEENRESGLEGLKSNLFADVGWTFEDKIGDLQPYIDFFDFKQEEYQPLFKEKVLSMLEDGKYSASPGISVFDYTNFANFSEDFLQSEEIKETVIRGLSKKIKDGGNLPDDWFFNTYYVTKEDLKKNEDFLEALKNAAIDDLNNARRADHLLNNGFYDYFNKEQLSEIFSDPEVVSKVKNLFKDNFGRRDFPDVLTMRMILKNIELPADLKEEFIISGLIGYLDKSNLFTESIDDQLAKIQEEYDFDDSLVKEAVRRMILREEIREPNPLPELVGKLKKTGGEKTLIDPETPLSEGSEEYLKDFVISLMNDPDNKPYYREDLKFENINRLVGKYGIDKKDKKLQQVFEKEILDILSGTKQFLKWEELGRSIELMSSTHKVFFLRKKEIHTAAMSFFKKKLGRLHYDVGFFEKGVHGGYKEFVRTFALAETEYEPHIIKTATDTFFKEYGTFRALYNYSDVDKNKIKKSIIDRFEHDWDEVVLEVFVSSQFEYFMSETPKDFPEFKPYIDRIVGHIKDAVYAEKASTDVKMKALSRLGELGIATKSEKAFTSYAAVIDAPASYIDQYINGYSEPKDQQIDSKKLLKELVPWSVALVDIYNTQKPSSNAAHDPWSKELQPLMLFAIKKNLLFFESKEDGELLAEFVKKFGMQNTPKLLGLFLNIQRAENSNDIDDEVQDTLKNHLGIDVRALFEKTNGNIGEILTHIESFKDKIFKGFIESDEKVLNGVVESPYVKEIFDLARGRSGYGEDVAPEEALRTFFEERKNHPEKYELKEGYERVSFEIRERGQDIPEEEIESRKKEVIQNEELRSQLKVISEVMDMGIKEEVSFDLLYDYFDEEIEKAEQQLFEMKQRGNEKAVFGLEKKVESLENTRSGFYGYFGGEVDVVTHPDYLVPVMEKIAEMVPDNFPEKKKLLMGLSLVHMQDLLPGAHSFVMDNFDTKETHNETFLENVHEFLPSQIKEHYLNPGHQHDGSFIGTEDKKLLKLLSKYWQVEDYSKSIFATSAEKLKNIQRGTLSDKSRSFEMIPSKGVPLIFSGDLGGACTSNQRKSLAEGEYDAITGYAFVTGQGTKQERFVGSCLLVETETDEGEPIIVVRANNPAQNLFMVVDGVSLIERTLDEAKAVAKRRGIKHIAVPIESNSTQSASNRHEVWKYYVDHFKDSEKIGLKNDKNTNFNGYTIWNKEGDHPVVKIPVE